MIQENKTPQINLSLSLGSFQAGILQNFKIMNSMLMDHTVQIADIKRRVSELKIQPKLQSEIEPKIDPKIQSLNNKQIDKNSENNLIDKQTINPNLTNQNHPKEFEQKQEQMKNSQIGQTIKQKDKQQINKVKLSEYQSEKKYSEQIKNHQSMLAFEKGPPILTSDSNDMMERITLKMVEISNRMNQMQFLSKKQERQIQQNLQQVERTAQKNLISFQKNNKSQKQYNSQIQQLRNQLAEYKLKKQSQFMRAMGNSQIRSSSNDKSNAFSDYVIDKVHYLLKIVGQLVPRSEYDQQLQRIEGLIDYFRVKMKSMVSGQDLEANMGILISKFNISQNENHDMNKSGELEEKSSVVARATNEQLEATKNDLNRINKQLSLLSDDYQRMKQSLITQKQKYKKQINIINQRFQAIEANQAVKDQKIKHFQDFSRDMNSVYNTKIHEMSTQIIDGQQNMEKMDKKIKQFQFINQPSKSVDTLQNRETQQQAINSKSNIKTVIKADLNITNNPENNLVLNLDFTNELNILKKKVNKLILKVQNTKQDNLKLRDDLARDLDFIKMALEKKTDWETLKKAVGFFEDKIKQNADKINTILTNVEGMDNNQSTAAKKGWTCLCCDKDIKSFEGKMGQAKFTSIFPVRYESPRIGGYYKQQQGQKDYRQIYMGKRNSLNKINKQQI